MVNRPTPTPTPTHPCYRAVREERDALTGPAVTMQSLANKG